MAAELDFTTITTIISNINSLYGNLVSYTVGLVLFVGAFVPAVISFFQRKQFTREYEDLNKKMLTELRDKISEAEIRLKESIAEANIAELEKIKASSLEMKEELLKEIGLIRASAFHLQANQNDEIPQLCLTSCSWALPLYIEGEDEKNARTIIAIAEETVKSLNKDDLSETPEIEEAVLEIIKTLKGHDTNGRYSRDISSIEKSLREANKRVKPS